MKSYDTQNIKNIALLGHAGSGKTTLVEAMLFEAGKINRRGSVEDKNTVSDYREVEHERGYSVSNTLLNVEWKDHKINIMDTPGTDDFIGDVVSGLNVVDTGVMVLNAQYGPEVGTEMIWEHIEALKTPIIFAINQIDHEHADFDRALELTKSQFGSGVVQMQYPVGQGSNFEGIIDLLKMTYYKFGPEGGKPEKLPIPDSEKEKADQLHNELVEAAAANDESLMELYFEKGSLDEDELRQGLSVGIKQQDIFPVFVMSAKENKGSGRMMGFIGNVAPSSAEMPPIALENGETLECDSNGSTVAFIFKTSAEPHLGEMSYFKVCSGTIKHGQDLYNEQSGHSERLNQLYVMDGKNRLQVDELKAGDIGATVKLKTTHTNNTLHEKGQEYSIRKINYPEPSTRTALIPTNSGEEDKMATALHHLVDEDPGLNVEHSQELGQVILHGQGEMHLAITKWKLENQYGLHVDFIEPRIPYRETINRSSKADYRHKKQSGGSGQFGEVHMLMEPYHEGMPDPEGLNVRGRETVELPWGGTLEFLNCIVGGAIDTRFLGAIQKGCMEKMENGPLTGCYVRDVRVSIYDGKMHAVDSNDMAFKLAAVGAFKEAFANADPKLLEPIYDVEVTVPDDMMGDVMSDLQTRRAIIGGMTAKGHYQILSAKVPLAELYKYSSALRSITQGRAKHSRKFAEYQLAPTNVQQDVIKQQHELEEA